MCALFVNFWHARMRFSSFLSKIEAVLEDPPGSDKRDSLHLSTRRYNSSDYRQKQSFKSQETVWPRKLAQWEQYKTSSCSSQNAWQPPSSFTSFFRRRVIHGKNELHQMGFINLETSSIKTCRLLIESVTKKDTRNDYYETPVTWNSAERFPASLNGNDAVEVR
jgi:hypothetical protein